MAQLSYRQHRFPASIIQHAIWLYLRFTRGGKWPTKPIRRRRADRKEVDWYGFAAQGGCTRLLGQPCC
jgi:hypothetical protein